MLKKILNIVKTSFLLILLVGISIMPWLGYLEVPIMNEDFLILSWMEPSSLFDTFSNFFEREVGGPYWRPVVWTMDSMTKFFVGYEASIYHLTNILVYSAICILFYNLMRKIGFEKRRAWLGAFVFSILPSHELSVAWIAGRTDTVMAFFILLGANALIGKEKFLNMFAPLFFFLMAMLSKEPAFAAPALPFLFLLLKDKKLTRKDITRSSIIAGIISGLVIFVFLYRFIFIGGSPFDSQNFSNLSFASFFENLIIYIPVSILRADQLEILYASAMSNPTILYISISMGLLLLVFFVLRYRKMEFFEKRLALFGILWYLIFILPACAHFGQWYAFTASMGLIISLLSFVRINLNKAYYRYIFYTLIFIGSISTVIISVRSNKWLYSGEIAKNAFQSIQYEYNKKDTLIFLGVPDKIDMVNTMKIGFTQAIWHYLDNDSIDVSSQLRMEMDKESFISYERLTDNQVKMEVHNGRFLPLGSGSRAVLVNEKLSYEDGYQSFEIETRVKPNILSKAIITIKDTSLLNKTYIFNGNTFIPLKNMAVEEKSKKIYF